MSTLALAASGDGRDVAAGWRFVSGSDLARVASSSSSGPLLGTDAERQAALALTGAERGVVTNLVAQPQPPPPREPWAPPAPVSPQPLRPAVLRADFPDPSVVWANDAWYAFATQGGGRTVQVATSSDLVRWSDPVEAVPQLPPWSQPGETWAPSVARIGDHWVMYVTIANVFGSRCVERLVAPSPGGPYAVPADLTGSLVCQETGGWGAIDPSVLVSGGSAYLYWKSDGPGPSLWGARLTADGLSLAGAPSRLLQPGASWEKGGVENPSMVPTDGSYWLFYSGAYWGSSAYAIGYAQCDGPLGPCSRVTNNGPWVGGRGDVVGPGGASAVVGPDGGWRLAYHAWRGGVGYGKGGSRVLHVEPISFDGGRPALISHPPSGSVDGLADREDGVVVSGTVHDPDTGGAIAIMVTVNGQAVVDVEAGGGFSVVLPLVDGHHRICVTAIDDVGQSAIELGCGEIDVVPSPTDEVPID